MGSPFPSAVEASAVQRITAWVTCLADSYPEAQPKGRYCGRPASPISGGRHFRGTENKPLTAVSNCSSNGSRNTATLSESTTSNFLIATKSETRRKGETDFDRRRPQSQMCASATARLASGHSQSTVSGRCNVTLDFSIDFDWCRTGLDLPLSYRFKLRRPWTQSYRTCVTASGC
jgi:hypothetical protein